MPCAASSRHQRRVRLERARHDQQPAGVLVDAVHEAGARHALELRVMREQRVLQRVLAIARARVHHEPRRLVDHDDRGVLVHDVERQLFGGDAGLLRQARFHAPPTRRPPPRRVRGAARPLIFTAPCSIQRWMRVREYCGRSWASA